MAVARKKPGSKAKKKAAIKKPAAAKKPAKKKKVVAAAKSKKAAPKPKKTSKVTKPEKKTAVAKKTSKAAAKTTKKTPPKKAKVTSRAARKKPAARRPRIPGSLPSERAIAVSSQLPKERALTDEEREAMTKVAQTALALLEEAMQPGSGEALAIVRKIGEYVDAVRAGAKPEPKTQDERLGIGVLWGEQVRAQVGWRWVHLSYPDGFASYALVPDDRAFACFPLNRLAELVRHASNGQNTSVPLFDSIRAGTLPQRRENAYLVIG